MIRVSVKYLSEVNRTGLDGSAPKVSDALYAAGVPSNVSVSLNGAAARHDTPLKEGDVVEATPVSGKAG